MNKRLSVDELDPIAREATRNALEQYTNALEPFRKAKDLTLTTLIEDDVLTFQLYIAREVRSEALMLASTRVSRLTGDILGVEVHHRNSLRNSGVGSSWVGFGVDVGAYARNGLAVPVSA